MVKIIIITLTILLLQPVYVVDSIPMANQHYIVYFPNKREVFLYDLTNRTSKKIAEFREKGFEIDFGSVKCTDNKIYLSTQNRNNVHFGYVPDSNYTLQFQEGNMVQKDYVVSIDGNCKYIKMRETKALNNEMIEIKETNFDSKAEITEIKIWCERNRRSFISPILFKCIEKNGIKLIVDKRSLYMEKKQGERQCLINSDKKISYKVAYGCYDPSINKEGLKGLCSYYPYPLSQKDDKSAIIEINLSTNQMTRHEISGREPSFSSDDNFILYSRFYRDDYRVFSIHDKIITKLPKAKFARWLD